MRAVWRFEFRWICASRTSFDRSNRFLLCVLQRANAADRIVSLLGEGTFGKVVECIDRDTRENVAVKIIRAVSKYTEAAEIEIEILNDLRRRAAER